MAHGWSPIASHFFRLHLEPGESRTLIFVLGYVENPADAKFAADGTIDKTRAHELLAAFDSEARVDAAFAALNRYWDDLLSRFHVESGCAELDRMVNIWNQYQCMPFLFMTSTAAHTPDAVEEAFSKAVCIYESSHAV